MKLVIGGSTGFVATEVVRQALQNPTVTSIVALSRRKTPTPPDAGSNAGKLKSVVCDDFENYPDHVKNELRDADACIWTIAVTPSKLKSVPFDEASKVSRDFALTAIQTLDALRQERDKPLRFIYMSGHFAPRSQKEVPEAAKSSPLLPIALMRGEAEAKILAYGEQSSGAVESCVIKPGLIDAPGREKRAIPGVPNVNLSDVVAAMLDQVVRGFEKDTLRNEDLVRIGQKALAG